MVSKEFAVGLMGFPLCFLNLPVRIFLRWRVHGRPPLPPRGCSAYLYPHDSDANYCQTCGTLTRLPFNAALVPPVDETAIQERFDEFQYVFRSKPYERQKSAFEQQLFKFLGALSPPRTVASCTAQDIVKFLISKDKLGRTVAHSLSCSKRDSKNLRKGLPSSLALIKFANSDVCRMDSALHHSLSIPQGAFRSGVLLSDTRGVADR